MTDVHQPRSTGIVTEFLETKGFGFIRPNDGKERHVPPPREGHSEGVAWIDFALPQRPVSVFVHRNNLIDKHSGLKRGDRVVFDERLDRGKYQAYKCSVLDRPVVGRGGASSSRGPIQQSMFERLALLARQTIFDYLEPATLWLSCSGASVSSLQLVAASGVERRAHITGIQALTKFVSEMGGDDFRSGLDRKAFVSEFSAVTLKFNKHNGWPAKRGPHIPSGKVPSVKHLSLVCEESIDVLNAACLAQLWCLFQTISELELIGITNLNPTRIDEMGSTMYALTTLSLTRCTEWKHSRLSYDHLVLFKKFRNLTSVTINGAKYDR